MEDITTPKKVKFAEDTKPPASGESTPRAVTSGTTTPQVKTEGAEDEPKISGLVGQLEVYQSGAVKIRFGNGILFDVRIIVFFPSTWGSTSEISGSGSYTAVFLTTRRLYGQRK